MEPGTRIGHYEIVRPLGSGGMGEVWVARDRKLDREVALKVLPAKMAASPERLERFEREAKAIAALTHPNIVTIHSVETDAERPYLTMELVDGRPLGAAIAPRGLDLDAFFALAIPLVDAVAAAHERGIAHRDLKPDNVMVTPEGRVKVLDFGLAKLLEDGASGGAFGGALEGDTGRAGEGGAGDVGEGATEAATRAVTEEGQILGTVAYMSPEQAEGRTVDHRSDIFSLGILLYEMATGERPFRGDSRLSILSSILKDTPPSVTELKGALPRHLGRIVRRCIEKDPERRFQSAKDLRNELEGLRDEVTSGEVGPSEAPEASVKGAAAGVMARDVEDTGGLPGRSWLPWALGIAAIAVIAVLMLWRPWRSGPVTPTSGDIPATAATPATPAGAGDTRPSVAVLWFDNLGGDASLDWMRRGLADMLITDLAQSPGLRVLTTDRLYQILREAGLEDGEPISDEVVQAVAREGRVENVVLGSFVRAGDTLRLSARLQEASSGEVLLSESVEGRGEESIFESVDQLTDRVKERLAVEPAAASVVDRDLTDITTDSVEAFRHYVEGNEHLLAGRYVQALPRFRSALDADPGFAMAMAKISICHNNLFNAEESRVWAERALENADRLSERERLYIQAVYHSQDPESADRTIDAYERLIELYPDDEAARNNLALEYFFLERFEEANEHWEQLFSRGYGFVGIVGNYAGSLMAAGRFDRAREVLEEAIAENPDEARYLESLVILRLFDGDVAAARETLARMDEVDPDVLLPPDGRAGWDWGLAILEEDWEAALRHAGRMQEAEIAFARFVAGPAAEAITYLYQGRLDDALLVLEDPPEGATPEQRSQLLAGAARVALDTGRHERALATAERAQAGAGPGIQALLASCVAAARSALGQRVAAEAVLDDLRREVVSQPVLSPVAERLVGLAEGALSLQSGDAEAAVESLERAEELLPAVLPPPVADHPDVWYRLGLAHLEAGRLEEARSRFQRIVDAGFLRLYRPLPYVRSFYQLGAIHRELGDADAARRNYRRFLEYWGDGDIDPDRVADAREFLDRG